MPTQIFIIPPKQTRPHKSLTETNSDRSPQEGKNSQSVPSTPLNEQITSSSENKLSVIKVIPSVRISPPQQIIDSLLDWDDEDRHFGRRPTFIRNRQQQKLFHERLAKIQEGIVQTGNSTISAVVSAPIAELPGGQSTTNATDHTTTTTSIKQEGSLDTGDTQGQTLLHLAAKLGHEEIMRMLISETSHANMLLNARGQTPLLCAIEAGATSTATLLMEQDPLSLTCKDHIGSSVFHYATEQRNDIVLSRAISLLKRLSSSAARVTALQRLVERNSNGKTPFVIAIEKGSLKCIKYILSSKWLHRNVEIADFINSDSLKTTIDKDQLDIASFFVSDTRRFAAIIQIQIDVNGRAYNVLEYAIALKKSEFVRTFISVRIPGDERELYRSYKNFLRHYNVAYSGSSYDQTPVQRMLTMTEMVPLVPLLLEQFVGEDGIDLSVVDDCLRARPSPHRCIFGRSKRFSTSNWLKQHPLSLIAEANHAPVYDHDIVKMCVDLKFQLFGNFLYLLILCAQVFFVCLYTGVALSSPTPPRSYYDAANITCKQLCEGLTLDPIDPLPGNVLLRFLRALLLLCSGIALLKEFIQLLTQREKYFRGFFVNFLELHTYVCAILFAMDLNQCTQRTGLRCKWQWEAGALGMASVWTLLLLVFMNALKIGKYGLLFVSVFLTFLKFCLIYVFIWIGYIIAFHMLFVNKKPQFTSVFYSIPKTLAMLTGEYDFDDLFFPNGKVLQGSEAAMVLYSTFVFTMNIVIMNIMVGLAVSDVKRFRLNAKREHLRARIETCLGLQAKFGLLCETCSRLVLALSKRSFFPRFQNRVTQIHGIKKYYLWKLELRTPRVDLPQSTIVLPYRNSNNQLQSNIQSSRSSKHHSTREFVTCEIGYYRHHIDRAGEPLLQENDHTRLMRKTDELRDVFEKANARVHNELRKLTMSLQSDFDEIKRKLLEG
ncbi:unnamed protein product [Adineta steineri]|uniref:Ion transport domain-containing protein n=1 Tax=Adineta steineri TaxID=433720 RepID=A0A818QC86_9BILA|nr:unnamed protein product [Adineta steineri]CAF3632657.1 unnamed protein product [Adineta steineri]